MSLVTPRYDQELTEQAKAILAAAEDGDVVAEAYAHGVVIEQHRTFFKESFGIDINGVPLGSEIDRVTKGSRLMHHSTAIQMVAHPPTILILLSEPQLCSLCPWSTSSSAMSSPKPICHWETLVASYELLLQGRPFHQDLTR
jgi:hypothetical protein